MDASRPASGRFYRPELDVVRFLAFFLVFIYHLLPRAPEPRTAAAFEGFAPILYVCAGASRFGLSLFFTLSAFLICELLIREREASGIVRVKQFYIRRILRIWPLYYFCLALAVLIDLLPGGNRADIVNIGWYAIFMGGWYSAIYGGLDSPMQLLWSVSIEEQFYVFAPWVVKYLNRKSLYGFCLALFLSANVCLFYLGRVHAPGIVSWYNSLVQFECFGAGILLCLILHGRLPKIALWQRLVVFIGAWSCWLIASYWQPSFSTSRDPGSWALIGVYGLAALGCTLVLVAFLGISPKLLPGWIVYLGRISYGLYVYHMLAVDITKRFLFGPVISYSSPTYFLKGITTLGLTILMAAVSYRYFETPFLKMKRRHAVIASEPVGARVELS